MTDSTPLLPAGLLLSDDQIDRLQRFGHEVRRMNQHINLVSSETEEEFWKRHTAHCLALATRSFAAGSRVVDWGTGGGLPAIPLAIAFPDCEIIGVDSVRKKVQSCRTIVRRLGLGNCTFIHSRAEHVTLNADVSVSRATAPLATLWAWHKRVATTPAAARDGLAEADAVWPRGLICLKGGDMTAEIEQLNRTALNRTAAEAGNRDPGPTPTGANIDIQTFPLPDLFDDPWFENKMIVRVAETS